MSKFLKKNFGENGVDSTPEASSCPENSAQNQPLSSESFEQQAIERLGGSIAFVLKGKNFVWSPGKK